MTASSRLDLDNELNRNDETRNAVDFQDGDFPALKPNYDWRAHAHHSTYREQSRTSDVVNAKAVGGCKGCIKKK